MKLNFETYKDKVYACWIGKNIGGTMGAPYEGVRSTLDIKGFATKPKEVLPNDDLDLQLVWLHAIEQEGPKKITAELLGDYWLSYLVAYCGEYGVARKNMERGVTPPLCGDSKNNNVLKTSNGAWIRTEVWATLAPASPDLAVRYAIEDSKVDHGVEEGTYAAMFVAAVESAAFVVSDVRKLVEIGLAKIPAECRMARSIRLLLKCYDEGKTWLEARNAVFEENADIGDGWFQAPSNVSYAMLGILYGEGDFKKSMLTAINCGDDTDCTAATVGSILGIMNGTAGIPKDWSEYIGDDIITLFINGCVSLPVPANCTDLTARVVKLAPFVLYANRASFGTVVELVDGETEVSQKELDIFPLPYGQSEESDLMRRSVASLKPHTFTVDCGCVTAIVTVENGSDVRANEEKKLTVSFINNVKAYGNQPHNVRVGLSLPEGWIAEETDFEVYVSDWRSLTRSTCQSIPVTLTVKAPESIPSVNEIGLTFAVCGRYKKTYAPIVLLNRLSHDVYIYPEKFNRYF